jgi:hypothetical protein
MATEVGLVGVAASRSGIGRSIVRQGNAVYKWDTTEGQVLGWGEMESTNYDASVIGSVQSLVQAQYRNREVNGAYGEVDILREIFDKQCGDCHLGNAGANNRYADFRTSGCGSCHMSYSLDGRSRSVDQMIKKDEPTYPAAYAQISNFNANDLQNLNGAWLGPERAHPSYHRLTRTIASQRCGSCHVGSNRTDWQFRGYRFDPNRDAVLALDNARLNADQIVFTDEIDNDANPFARYHGAAQNQILKFEDWNNDGQDDSPADIHFVSGMECMDCHTSGEMHNEIKIVKVAQVDDWESPAQVTDTSGMLFSHMDQSTEIECVSCHGNLEYRAMPYKVDNRNPVKWMVACAELGETLPADYVADPEVAAECGRLGRGRFVKGKFDGKWRYVPQVLDTVRDVGQGAGGGPIRPNGGPVYSLNASIFHGRFNQDLNDGAGPCPNGNIQNCFKDQANNQFPVTQGFSHLGSPAQHGNDQATGGLECYTCHATWVNACFGCHMTLADNDGNQIIRDFARWNGEYGYGVIA